MKDLYAYKHDHCRICGEEIDTNALSTIKVKPKKPGKPFYMHDECFLRERLELKKEAAEK